MTKIDVFSGFLGAGKTTLIKKLLKEALEGSKTVLIENEFGEIGIDGGFLKEAGIEIKEMNSGCICCSLVGDFGTSLKEVIETYAPERILIEPSGVGKLSDVLKAVEDVAADLNVQVNSAVAVVDASKAKVYIKNFGEFFINQIEFAGTVILSRTDKVNAEKLEECVRLIREHNAKATIITTPLDQLEGKVILETIEGADTLDEMMHEMMEQLHTEDEHAHEHEHHAVATIITTTTRMKRRIAVATIITTMTRTKRRIAVATTIITMTWMKRSITIITIMNAGAVITIIITMQMKCLPAGVRRRLPNIPQRRLKLS